MLVKGDYMGINHVDPMPLLNEREIKSFLQGSVYTWCNIKNDTWFNARYFVAMQNKDWSNTPLIYLYTRRINQGMTEIEAREKAKFDLGNMLKIVVNDDIRPYETLEFNGIRNYRWLPTYTP